MALSVEPHWGRFAMMFEVSAGALWSYAPHLPLPNGVPRLNFAVGQTFSAVLLSGAFQVCPLDLAFAHTGLNVLVCTKMATAINDNTSGQRGGPIVGSPFWLGVNARLRWQSPWRFYAEARLGGSDNLVQGQSSMGLPNSLPGSVIALDVGGTIGLRI